MFQESQVKESVFILRGFSCNILWELAKMQNIHKEELAEMIWKISISYHKKLVIQFNSLLNEINKV